MKTPTSAGSIRKVKKLRNGKTYEYWEASMLLGFDARGKAKRRYFTASTQREALRKMREAQRDFEDNGGLVDIPSMTVEKWMRTWMEEYMSASIKELSLDAYNSRIDNHIVPGIGAYKLSDINTVILQKFCNELTKKKKLSSKTVINIMAILQKALDKAVELEFLPKNPALNVVRPRKVQKHIKPLTQDELARFLAECEQDPLANMIKLTVMTGMREGEVCGLSWNDVDLKRNTITIRQQLQKRKTAGAQYYLTTAKEDKIRTIVIGESVKELLYDQMRHQQEQMMSVGMLWKNFEWKLVFTDGEGKYVVPETFRKHVKRIARSIGRDDIYVHSLRHTYAVNSLQEGDDMKTVQANLGHATAAFTLDVYGHVSEEMKKASADRMDELYKRLKG